MFTTRIASVIYGCWYLVALLIMIFQNGSTGMVVLAAIFVGFGIGGIGVTALNRAYWIFFAGSCIAIVLILFIKPDPNKVNIE